MSNIEHQKGDTESADFDFNEYAHDSIDGNDEVETGKTEKDDEESVSNEGNIVDQIDDANESSKGNEKVEIAEEKLEDKEDESIIHDNEVETDIPEESLQAEEAQTKLVDVPDTKSVDETTAVETVHEEHISLANDMESIDSEASVIRRPELPTRIETTDSKNLPELPTRETTEQPKTPINWFSFSTISNFENTAELISSPINMNLAYHRYTERENESKSEKDQNDIVNSRNSLKKTFNDIKAGVSHNEVLANSIDWEFWSLVSNNYNDVVMNKQTELKKNITAGIPNEIRGMIWQIISDSNSIKLKEFFINTKDYNSEFANMIRRDLVRTRFVKDSQINDKLDDLFNIIKTYSLYDTEVGYTQGMAFITVPLLMNMESDEAFCALVRLMFTYGLRDFFLPEMPGLHLRIYQFDRLLEDFVPDLYQHLQNENIKSSMYAIQWFLTFFAYKFPLAMVLRIFDVVIAEGLESILKFALNLMIKNHDHLLTLKFEGLLEFLKEKIFYYYFESCDDLEDDEKIEDNKWNYKIDEFIKDSMEINILPLILNKYKCEYDEVTRIEQENAKKVLELQSQNGMIIKEIRKVEANYAILNKEHMEIANEMVNGKMSIGSLEEENKSLQEMIEELRQRLENLQSSTGSNGVVDFTSDSSVLSEGLDKEIQKAMETNLQVMDENQLLEEELANLEATNQQLKSEHGKNIGSMFKLKKGKFWK
ncbi:hypothetical protein CANINC_001108 [Pichia inconspicua]|uniref:GTPase-activating protein GYP5 n=1 Tax=Pichia inconspicua TaxID=52247 RepID=A0A4T0X4E9_9ASCO|nr:hypothetical protein CANINC_001108 [[Candida] inconspicua]